MGNKERYIQNAKDIIAMLEAEPDFIPNMETFVSHNACGTTYCLAGKQAQLEGFPEDFIEDGEFKIVRYSEKKCGGYSVLDFEWSFLYSACWPNSREHATKRCQYIIDNDGDIPGRGCWGEEWRFNE